MSALDPASIDAAATQATVDAYAAAVAPSMLDASEPPSCLAGGVTTRGDVAPLAHPLGWTLEEQAIEEAARCNADPRRSTALYIELSNCLATGSGS